MEALITPNFGEIFGILLFVSVVVVLVIFALAGITYVSRYEVGIKTKRMFGEKMPQGQVIARNGEIGIQADTLMPGLYWFNPITWRIEKERITVVSETEIATMESIDGKVIPAGRLLADAVECDSFQDATKFLNEGGMKGPQVGILRPGTYRINTRAFIIKKHPVTKIPEEHIGVVVAMDGKPLPADYLISPAPEDNNHNHFNNGQEFIRANGYRGPQLATLQPGEYYINPMLFEVQSYPIAEVPPGYVAVLRSNVGKELVKPSGRAVTSNLPMVDQPVHEEGEVILTFDRLERGIWDKPVAPGKYNMNPLAYTAYLVPTSAVTIDWASGSDLRSEHQGAAPGGITIGLTKPRKKDMPREEFITGMKASEFFKFSQLTLTSKDGFTLDADVRVIVRVHPDHAPFVIARFGTVPNLIEQIIHPLIDSSFRNNAGSKKAIEFIQSRTALQKDAFEKAKEEFEKYHVETQGLLISYIAVDKALLDTQTFKEIALQQKEQYQEQARAQEENIVVQEKTARAAKQKEVIDATLSIKIKEDMAEARRKEAAGNRDGIKYEADGIAYRNREEGKGIADAYEAQSIVIGPERLALLKIFEQVAVGKIKVVPDFLVNGGAGSDGNLFNTWIATMLASQMKKPTDDKTAASNVTHATDEYQR